MSEQTAERALTPELRRSICYCPNRGDNYHLSGDPGCVSDVVTPPEEATS